MLDISYDLFFRFHDAVYGRKPENENEIKLLNVLKNEKYLLDAPIFPKNRLQDLRGKSLNAVTFVRPADVYIENGEWAGIEVYKYNFKLLFIRATKLDEIIIFRLAF